MERIDTPTAVEGAFVGPDVGLGRKGTKVTPEWLNQVQEEIVGLIEEADLVPSAEDTSQLRKAVMSLVYPAGSVYITYQGELTPYQLFGIGTWVEIGSGRVLVGLDEEATAFDTIGKTGGAASVALTQAQMPKHAHMMRGPNSVTPPQGAVTSGIGNYGGGTPDDAATDYQTFSTGGGVGPADKATGEASGEAHENLQPYIVVKMWRRTA